MGDTFATSEKASDLIRDFLARISLIRDAGGFLSPTTEAEPWLRDKDSDYVVALLHARVRFIGEMLELLTEPATIEAIRLKANTLYSMEWSTRAQVDRRRGWLQSAGMVTFDDDGRLQLTETGVRFLSRITPTPVILANDAQSITEPVVARPESARELPVTEVDELVRRFRVAASNTSDSTEFERITADVFRFLGFAAEHLGGAGRTDVLVVAPLGPVHGYRVAVDCKTTSHSAVSDPQIDWITLAEHRTQHQADFSAVVGSAFRASRVEQRARAAGVALLDVETLAGLCSQHLEIPLGLDVYRRLFDPSHDSAVESIASVAEEEGRWLALASEVIRAVIRLQTNEGAVVARDVYWNLERDADSSITVEDIECVMATLVSPPIGVLRRAGDGYVSLGSAESCIRRIARLGELVATPSRLGDEV